MTVSEQMSEASTLPYATVSGVVSDDLCHSCGVCGGICPKDAIDFDERARPLVDLELCNGCGLCVKVCSGWQGQAPGLAETIEGENTYLTASANDDLRLKSASGGLVTELLSYLLDEGFITRALVTIADPHNPARPISILAKTSRELADSASSRYCLFPWGLPLNELLKNSEPFAVVGTSCQLSSFEYAARQIPRLRKNNFIKIGICCESNIEPRATDHLLKNRQLKIDTIKRLDYRSGPWPGVMAAFKEDEREIILSNRNRLEGAINYLKLCYGRDRCRFCSDVLCESSDIVVGDPWGRGDDGRLTYRNCKGLSAALVRSTKVTQLLHRMYEKGRISLEEDESCLDVQKTQAIRGRERVKLEIGTANKIGAPFPGKGGLAPASYPVYRIFNELTKKLKRVVRVEPFRSLFLKLMLSSVGDRLALLNNNRKRNKAKR